MNSEFQVIRWGIPGWIFLMTYWSLRLCLSHFLVPVVYQSLNATVLFGAIGIPIGYLIYQVYFGAKWSFPSKRCYFAIQGISDLQYLKRMKPSKAWRHIESYFDHLMTVEVKKSCVSEEDLKRRYASYSSRTSRTHGLGASIWAILLGLACFYLFHWSYGKSAIGLTVAWLVIAAILLVNYSYQNTNTYKMLNAMMKDIDSSKT